MEKFLLAQNVVAAGELATLHPHILQHIDNSVSFHIHKVSICEDDVEVEGEMSISS